VNYRETIRRLASDPEGLELAYQQAAKAGKADAFAAALAALHEENEQDVLLSAWHYRFAHAASAARRAIAWAWAVPLAAVNGLVLWLLSDEQRYGLHVTNPFSGAEYEVLPAFVLLASPIAASIIVLFLAAAGDRRWRRALAVAIALAALTAYVLVAYPHAGPRVYQEQYLILMTMHLTLLAWAGIGAYALYGRSDAQNRFAFLVKSLEFVVVAGLFGIIGGMFTAVTFGLFDALGMLPPDAVVRLFVAGGSGLIAVLAAALTIEPGAEPRRQPFDEGPSRLVATLLRILLPPALVVLVVYLGFIPANFREPFENRDVLIAFNAMLFAVVGLVVGAVPLHAGDLDARSRAWLRRGVVALVALALLVGVYALAAIVYRTVGDRLTPNRLTFIGWNLVNIAALSWLLAKQRGAGEDRWLSRLHETFAGAMVPYVAWSALTLLALPWLFGIDQGNVEDLPTGIRLIVFEQPNPILLKCRESPHVYSLDGGRKRWIRDIPTFEAEGYQWRDVRLVPCAEIDAVPYGDPIPADAGMPPDE